MLSHNKTRWHDEPIRAQIYVTSVKRGKTGPKLPLATWQSCAVFQLITQRSKAEHINKHELLSTKLKTAKLKSIWNDHIPKSFFGISSSGHRIVQNCRNDSMQNCMGQFIFNCGITAMPHSSPLHYRSLIGGGGGECNKKSCLTLEIFGKTFKDLWISGWGSWRGTLRISTYNPQGSCLFFQGSLRSLQRSLKILQRSLRFLVQDPKRFYGNLGRILSNTIRIFVGYHPI